MDSYWYKHTIFLASRRGFFFYPMFLHSKYSEFCGEFKNG